MTDKQIRHMRDRFLNWTLPDDLNPDDGITFKRSESAIKYNHPMPTGTNFLDATQAEAMVRHMVKGIQGAGSEDLTPEDYEKLRADLKTANDLLRRALTDGDAHALHAAISAHLNPAPPQPKLQSLPIESAACPTCGLEDHPRQTCKEANATEDIN